MAFQNLLFVFYLLPVLLILYQVLPQKLRKIFLVLFSFIFYAWGEPIYVVLLVFIIFMNYWFGHFIDSQKGKARKRALIFCLVCNLFLLFYFKYYGFFLEELVRFLPLPPHGETLAMPLGISFYMFSILSYQIDIYRHKIPAEHHLLDFMLYAAWFPKLIMGPITRYQQFHDQLPLRRITREQLENGLVHFAIGMLEKVWIANQLAPIWQDAQQATSSGMAWLGMLAYTLEIYFDFQGYTQMALGLSEIFGIRLPQNFLHPYGATSITMFWRRWHVSLSLWFRDYVYIPLGGNRKGKGRQLRNLMIVWLLTGLWHGASWNFIFWGGYYGCLLILEKHCFQKLQAHIPAIVRWIITFVLVMIGWVFFASEDMSAAWQYLSRLLPLSCPLWDTAFLQAFISSWWLLLIAMLWSTPYFENLGRELSKEKAHHLWYLKPLGILCIWLLILMYAASDSMQSFLYFQF